MPETAQHVKLDDALVKKFMDVYRKNRELEKNVSQSEDAAAGVKYYEDMVKIAAEAGFTDIDDYMRTGDAVLVTFNYIVSKALASNMNKAFAESEAEINESLNDPDLPEESKDELRKTLEETKEKMKKLEEEATAQMAEFVPDDANLEVVQRHYAELEAMYNEGWNSALR